MPKNMDWSDYPIGTKVYACGGGHCTKTERGYQWNGGSTFNTPGGDWSRIEMPADQEKTEWLDIPDFLIRNK